MSGKLFSNFTLQQLKLNLLDQLLPLSCLLCRQPCNHPISLCSACQTLINLPSETLQSGCSSDAKDLVSPYWQTLRYLYAYETPIKELILQGKFEQNLAALKTLGQLYAKFLSTQNIDPELVLVPVPQHQNGLLTRGFNQTLEIALPIAKALNMIIHQNCVCKKVARTQHHLTRQQRKDNAQHIYTAVEPVPNKIAVIDDVFTTGATMQSICSCLQKAGAETIEVWIIARTMKQSSGILASK